MNQGNPLLVEEQIKELLAVAELEWFTNTKEKLSSSDVLVGLLDHGLFAEKIPPCFTSEGLAEMVMNWMGTLLDDPDLPQFKSGIDKCAHDYVRYEALRDSNIPRHLGIPHPEAYAVQVLAIMKHWQEIATHCNKPDPAFSRLHARHVGGQIIFGMNYKGNERFQYEEDELKWMSGAKYVVVTDIAKCFPSIYTHSIPWALHGKNEAKKKSSLDLAGNLLDKCTQNTRDRQTNGLLIGPHSSNIISEIILTQIDFDLQKKGYRKIKRYVDDYRFYAVSFEEAEKFIKDLGLALRAYEISLNEKKTQILSLPRPSEDDWVLVLNRFQFLSDKDLTFPTIRSYLDLALTCAQTAGKSTPLNYAIKVLSKTKSKNDSNEFDEYGPRKLCLRAKRMYTQEAINLALSYPYLAQLLDEFVFVPYWYEGSKEKISEFSTELIKLGLHKIYPDSISHALFLALKYDISLTLDDETLIKIIELDDCIANVLLLEYANNKNRRKIKTAIKRRVDEFLYADARDKDKHWLLIYQVWTVKLLRGNGQGFLAELKQQNFQFFVHPKISETEVECVVSVDKPGVLPEVEALLASESDL